MKALLIGVVLLTPSLASAQHLAVSEAAIMAAFPEVIAMASIERPSTAPTSAVVGAFLMPMADGFSTCYAMAQSGPVVRVVEGNGIYGANASCEKVLVVKALQSVLLGFGVREAGKSSRAMAIGASVVQAVVHGWATARNLRNAQVAQRLNGGGRR